MATSLRAVALQILALLMVTFSCAAGEIKLTQDSSAKNVNKLAIPQAGQAYSGAYIQFGDREDSVTLEAIEGFDDLVGKRQALIAFSSDWGNLKFPTKQLQIVSNYGAVPLIYWSPWDRPIGAPQARNRFALNKILAGAWDQYIDMWAKEAAAYGKPMFIAWGLEMNGNWFPWSGIFYGGGAPVPDSNPVRYEGPELYKKTYRYVVDRVRAAGATNIMWIFHANNTSDPEQAWNNMSSYYPGDDYVDWLGLSAYGQQYPDQGWPVVDSVIPKPYKELTKINADKPVILAEWGIGEFPKNGSKAAWLAEAFKKIQVDCPRIRGAVYWHERWQNGDLSYSNLHVNSSPDALDAFRRGILNSFWLDRPAWVRDPS